MDYGTGFLALTHTRCWATSLRGPPFSPARLGCPRPLGPERRARSRWRLLQLPYKAARCPVARAERHGHVDTTDTQYDPSLPPCTIALPCPYPRLCRRSSHTLPHNSRAPMSYLGGHSFSRGKAARLGAGEEIRVF